MLTPRAKIRFAGGSEEGQTRDDASRRTASPKHNRLSNSGLLLIQYDLLPHTHTHTHTKKKKKKKKKKKEKKLLIKLAV